MKRLTKTTRADQDSLLVSYFELRKAIGSIGIALPILVVLGKLIFQGPGIQDSISAYYYTVMGDFFVGSLWAMAIFLWSYRGYERRDDIMGDLACLFAIGVALFPTTPKGDPTSTERVIGSVHFGFAAALFLTLAYFCLALFRKGDPEPTPRKLLRNRVYTICGWIILGCIAGIALVSLPFLEDSPVQTLDPVFWLEAIAIWAFGWSWFTKGEGILGDRVG